MLSYRSLLVFSRFMLLSMFMLPGVNLAAVNIDKTRIVFNAGDTAQSVNLINKAESPAIVQIWTDEGDIHLSPDKSKTPVMAMPPIFNMQPGEVRSVKLMLTTRSALAPDKETLYWLNLYQIPAIKKSDGQNPRKLILPLRLRLKVFVRPTGLRAPQPEDAKKLNFILKGQELKITNPTPWYMSLNAKVDNAVLRDIMVQPHSYVLLSPSTSLNPGSIVSYEVINQNGNAEKYHGTLLDTVVH
ncbi:fimbrial assembly chaperone [Pantoea ananatis]|nr:fimbrial assembly chaperone [Pantoea ananatis]ASN15645.1 fimbrial assembly protein [Pantoea ananatis]